MRIIKIISITALFFTLNPQTQCSITTQPQNDIQLCLKAFKLANKRCYQTISSTAPQTIDSIDKALCERMFIQSFMDELIPLIQSIPISINNKRQAKRLRSLSKKIKGLQDWNNALTCELHEEHITILEQQEEQITF